MKKLISIALSVLCVAALFTGCAKQVSGQVATDGSTSMEKVIGALGESFMSANSGVTFTYNPTGSGSGIKAVQEGRCDIGLSSRALKDEETASGLVGTTVALDGIAIIVNPENPVSDLSVEQIASIYTGEITNWKDVGGNDAEIVLIGREAGSGTRDGFESITGTEDKCQYRQELTSTGDVITTVSQNPDAIGYASLSSVKDTVKAAHGRRRCSHRGHREGRQLRHPETVRSGHQGRHEALRRGPEVLRLRALERGRSHHRGCRCCRGELKQTQTGGRETGRFFAGLKEDK